MITLIFKIKYLLPEPLKALLKKFILSIKLSKIIRKHKSELKRIQKKEKVVVAFFLINVDSWKLDSLYWSFNNDDRFEAIIVLCPFISKGNEFLELEMNKGKTYCENKRYNYFVAYDEINSAEIDVKDIVKPDIVFFTNPNNLTAEKLCISNYLESLTCYVPYSFRIDTLYQYEFDNDLVNYTWINFYETAIHENLAKKYARNHGSNIVVSGYPFMDNYKNCIRNGVVWKSQDICKKKIIWAPHWTIKGYQNTGLDWSCFLKYHETILKIAEDFKSSIQVAMKPHPFLKNTLSHPSLWGIEKTEAYFERWQSLANCQIVEGDYVELFLESDALIHDSGSFMVEYLALDKPIAYTLNDEPINNRFNEFGQKVFSGHYLINSDVELENFVLNVIGGIDSYSNKRKEIIEQLDLNPNYQISANIVGLIKGKLG